jgi:hypothetical protein
VPATKPVQAGLTQMVEMKPEYFLACRAVAHHIAHRAGIQIWPHGLGTVGLFGMDELFGHAIERLVPRDRNELATALRASSPQRLLQAIGMMHAFRITRDLCADHASGIGIVLGAADATDGVVAENLDLERAGRRAIVRTDGREEAGTDGLIHRERSLPPSGHGEQCRIAAAAPALKPPRLCLSAAPRRCGHSSIAGCLRPGGGNTRSGRLTGPTVRHQ